MQNGIISLAIVFALVLAAGCAYPRKVTVAGPVLSKESLAFLDLKDATRAETIATLGSPDWESTNSRVLLYLSQTAIHWDGQVALPDTYDASSSTMKMRWYPINGDDNEKLKGLFVAYDTNGVVTSHLLGKIQTRPGLDYETLCRQYAQRAAKP